MKHTGVQEFTHLEVANTADIYKASVVDKLNIPTRRPLPEYEFADLFIESGSLNIVDRNNSINQLLDIKNTDIIKSLLASEIFYDEFMNFDKTDTGSFNEKIDINSEDFNQYDINNSYNVTTLLDSTEVPSIIITIDDVNEGDTLYTNLIEYDSYNIPIRTEITDSLSNKYIHMIYYDSIILDIETKKLTILLNSNNNINVLNDLTNIDILEIELNNFIFKDSTNVDNYRKLPYHFHELKEISDLPNNTNTEEGYVKLNDSELRFDFPLKLQPDIFSYPNSFLTKNLRKDILNNKLFNISVTEDSFTAEVNYIDSTIDLGGGLFIVEYEYTDTDIDVENIVKLETKNSLELNFSSSSSILMDREHEDSYLAEVLKFSYNNIINENSTGVTDTVDINYQLIDKTSIDNLEMQIYDITDNTVTVINNYYNIQIVQPNINTVPFILLNNNKLYKDDEGNVQISIPLEYENITGSKHLTLRNDSDVYLISDSTTLTFTIKYMNLLTGSYDEEYTYDNSYLNKKIKTDRGRIEIIPSDNFLSLSLTIFDRQY